MSLSRPLVTAFALLCLFTGTATAAEPQGRPAALQQLRIYEVPAENKGVFNTRFHDHAMRIMARYGFHIRATWNADFEGKTEFVYLLDWPDETTMREAWAGFMADEEWKAIKKETAAKYGRFVETIEDRTLVPTGFSPEQQP